MGGISTADRKESGKKEALLSWEPQEKASKWKKNVLCYMEMLGILLLRSMKAW